MQNQVQERSLIRRKQSEKPLHNYSQVSATEKTFLRQGMDVPVTRDIPWRSGEIILMLSLSEGLGMRSDHKDFHAPLSNPINQSKPAAWSG